MRAMIKRRSGESAVVDVYPARPGIPAAVLEAEILKRLNSFEGVKPNPVTSVRIIREPRPLRTRLKNNAE